MIRCHVEGSGPAVVLCHGFADGLESWWELGIAPRLARDHTVIAFDARGHGGSSRPHDPAAYSAHATVVDLVRVLDEVGIERAAVVGYSMGGWTALRAAILAPSRVSSIVIGGAHGEAFDLTRLRALAAAGLDRWAALVEATLGQPLPATARARLLANDPRALAACVATDRASLDVEAVTVPAQFYVGALDPLLPAVKRTAARMPRARVRVLSGVDHFGAFAHPEAGEVIAAHLADAEGALPGSPHRGLRSA